jgi:hypothetical protein
MSIVIGNDNVYRATNPYTGVHSRVSSRITFGPYLFFETASKGQWILNLHDDIAGKSTIAFVCETDGEVEVCIEPWGERLDMAGQFAVIDRVDGCNEDLAKLFVGKVSLITSARLGGDAITKLYDLEDFLLFFHRAHGAEFISWVKQYPTLYQRFAH